jgi:hypothetical protein
VLEAGIAYNSEDDDELVLEAGIADVVEDDKPVLEVVIVDVVEDDRLVPEAGVVDFIEDDELVLDGIGVGVWRSELCQFICIMGAKKE